MQHRKCRTHRARQSPRAGPEQFGPRAFDASRQVSLPSQQDAQSLLCGGRDEFIAQPEAACARFDIGEQTVNGQDKTLGIVTIVSVSARQ
jgi:hypothetical protein